MGRKRLTRDEHKQLRPARRKRRKERRQQMDRLREEAAFIVRYGGYVK